MTKTHARKKLPTQIKAINTKVRRKLSNQSVWDPYLRQKSDMMLADRRRVQSIKGYQANRAYKEYDRLFSPYLGKSIEEELIQLSQKRKGRKLHVFEDGPGEGYFLADIKKRLGLKGIRVHSTAVTLQNPEKIKKRGEIDEIKMGAIEEFLPERYQDVIISLNGGTHYSFSLLRKDSLLKLLHSLRTGGLACIGLDLRELEANPNFKASVKEKLRKNGFEANFYHEPHNHTKMLPNDILIVRKVS